VDSTVADESRVTVEAVQGTCRVTSCKSVPPLKILNPANLSHASMVYLSSYGGGMVQGDQVRLRITCGAGATAFVGSQANGRVFKHIDKGQAEQVIQAEVQGNGCVVMCPEPLVLHAHSRFVQRQEWQVAQGASLVLADWFQSGRSDAGEEFAYQAWTSEARIFIEGQLACMDRFRSDPAEDTPGNPARFGGRNLMLNLYVAGPVCTALRDTLSELAQFDELPQVLELGHTTRQDYPAGICGITEVEGQELIILRCLADTREDFDPVFFAVYQVLADETWLGFNPLTRKP
jgi:urease accessory protein